MRTADRSAEPRLARDPASDVAALVAAGALVAAVALSPEHVEDGPVLCPFRLLTGLPCPGCGLTRSWVYLVHGWWGESWAAHPFGVVTVLAAVGFVVAVLVARVRRRAGPGLERLVRHRLVWVVLAGWAGFALVRLVAAWPGSRPWG